MWLNLYEEVSPNFMSFILFEEKSKLVNGVLQYINLPQYTLIDACTNGTLMELIALRDGSAVLNDWFNIQVEKLVFQDNKIKVRPSVAYYTIFRRYRELGEVSPKLALQFQKLLEVNIALGCYDSDIFSTESGVRSLSLSGVSISFNQVDVGTQISKLEDKKGKLISQFALDYDEDMIGIY